MGCNNGLQQPSHGEAAGLFGAMASSWPAAGGPSALERNIQRMSYYLLIRVLIRCQRW